MSLPQSRADGWALHALLTLAAYVATGALGMLVSIPPSFASPLYPAAGLALVAVLSWGRPAALAVALGSACINLYLSWPKAGWSAGALLMPACAGAGAMLQAVVGAALVRRFVRQPTLLAEPRDLLRFYLLAALSCLISASVAVMSLTAVGILPAGMRFITWWTWMAGDTLGTLVGAPIAMTLIGRPAPEWRARRLTVGLPLLVVTVLMALGIQQMVQLDEDRERATFEREASSASSAMQARLREPLRALEAVHGVFMASDDVTRAEFKRATAAWLLPVLGVEALGWHQRVLRTDLPSFEAQVQAEGMPGYHVFDRTDAGPTDAATRPDVIAMRFIEPEAPNAAALGVNVLSIPAAHEAIDASTRSGLPVASPGFNLTQGGTGIVVYQAVYHGEPVYAADRITALRGAVFVTVSLEDQVRAVEASLTTPLSLCIVDKTVGADLPRLGGEAGCERPATKRRPVHVRPITFAGRQWEIRVRARPGVAADEVPLGNAWPFSIVGLLATAMVGALLLTMTGRARRIELAVNERTADLVREVAERKRTEAALRESEQRFRNMLDHVPIGVIYTDLDGRIRESNPRLREMTGYGAEELAGMDAALLTHPDDRAFDLELNRRLVRGEMPMVRRQKRCITRDQRVVWVSVVITVLRDGAGAPHRLVGVVEDITEHLRLQEAERARESAEAANRAKSDFLSRMSHELRTPLNAMLGFAQLLELDRQQPLATHQTEWTTQIQQSGWHLLHMINDTLDLSRIESGTLKLQTETLDVPELLRATRSLLEHNALRRGVTVREQLDPEATSVVGDLTRVKQIMTNLLSNAIKYNQQGGRVTIATQLTDAQTVQIEVSDTGLGMNEHQLAELFQPFNRLGRETSGEEGTGIGLVISQRLAELMGGTLRARSVEGQGSTFVLRLPRGRAGAAPPLLAEDGKLAEASYRRRIVHYVEDNDTNAEVMRGILAQRPQIQLEISSTGLDGLAAIRVERPSLVLLDMHLPDIDGLELLRHLKADDSTADIPVVVVSADATSARIREAMAAGAAQYLTKPVNVGEILAVLDEQLQAQDTRFG
ncbi:CHASE domain-containing protein [Aquincola tertiaricarbonis]|uniref:histidine kinase n=1 Tax=Aquincola tertiaricarbonis TaxID=391953 RepID=A0ABY4SC57_AQUTE|nr:CHASE domain-containing protein [Aquincola tertiaricarbonis]URI09318.1 CHASE domain-containing protein [Aquincola tertiaricarbonis]